MPHPALDISDRLHAILGNLMTLVMQQILTLGAYTMPVYVRIARARQRITRLLATLAAGRLPRQRAPRAEKRGGPKPDIHVPQSQPWLVAKIGYRAAGYGQQLEYLLNLPETQALLATAPPQALKSLGRTLRPLCRLLGVPLPPALILLSPRARAGGAGGGHLERQPKPKPEKPKLPPLLPLHRQRRPCPLPFLNFAKKPPPT